MGKLLLISVVSVAVLQAAKPQVLYDRARTGAMAVLANYSPQERTIRIHKTAPDDLKICFGDVCRTHAEWKKIAH